MSAKAIAINAEVDRVFAADWDERNGTVVPDTESVKLANGAVKLDAVFLYADLADSSTIARKLPKKTAAKVLRAYLGSMAALINHNDGEVRSFDGDRVMGVFVGGSKNTNAAQCALHMNHVVDKVLTPKAKSQFASVQKLGFDIRHCVGVASGEVLVVRAGVRGHNDLVFVGKAPNVAAKLSDVRNSPYQSYVTKAVFNQMNERVRLSKPDKKAMWEAVTRTVGDEKMSLYKTSWRREP